MTGKYLEAARGFAAEANMGGFFQMLGEAAYSDVFVDRAELIAAMLDGMGAKSLSARWFMRFYGAARQFDGPDRIRLMNRLAALRPRSFLLPRPKPAAPLLSSAIAGSSYCDRMAVSSAARGDPLKPVREPDNPYDKNAIRLDDRDGVKLGYVPKALNFRLAQMMDSGVRMTAVIRSHERNGDRIFLQTDIFERINYK